MGFMPNATRTADGRLWFPTRSGLARVDPEKQQDAAATPPVLLKRVAVDERTVAEYAGLLPDAHLIDLAEISAPLRVDPGHRKLQFDFTALSFAAPENVRFQYWLEGFDGQWIEGGPERHAIYSRLPAGQYQFRVRASNRSGLWNDDASALAFTVVPFIWQTWWFRMGTLIVFCSATVLAVRYVFFRRLRLRLRALEQEAVLHKERSRIARDLHDDLGSRLTRLVLLSDLMQDERDAGKTTANAQQVSSAARQVIKALDETVWAVNPRNDTLAHLIDYIGQFAVEFLRTAGIRCYVDLPARADKRPVSAEIRHNLFLVVKEALNNVVRHAGATEVRLRIESDGSGLTIAIDDNGRGFATGPRQAEEDGLRNMRQRSQEIGAEFDLESRRGEGTRILVRLPGASSERVGS
jgi:signal transduction histidine kinase